MTFSLKSLYSLVYLNRFLLIHMYKWLQRFNYWKVEGPKESRHFISCKTKTLTRNNWEVIGKTILISFEKYLITDYLSFHKVWTTSFTHVHFFFSKNESVLKRMAAIIREKGFFSLYRGIMPGTIRSFIANGTSMVVMTYAQRKVSQLGLRNWFRCLFSWRLQFLCRWLSMWLQLKFKVIK